MTNSVFWLGLSLLLLALAVGVLVCVSIPTLIGLARAARSAEKLFDTLDRELPRTLEAMRHTGADLSGLADDMTDGVSRARNIVKQVDHGLNDVRHQAHQAKRTTRSLAVGVRAAWRVLTNPRKSRSKRRVPVKPPPTTPVPSASARPFGPSNQSIEESSTDAASERLRNR